ncbi:hypothetical protein CPB83DRAFT_690638 [Crepidotus variabilis]|uniref:Uncharacterized protein n=1 Tax=Crepidotus variabilis TaxID=179855 RepID=A0A9P6E6Q7_9AGAR|nr:hypothetical protein CPB83DRAFT_690638 [Crepidotus variabilis]
MATIHYLPVVLILVLNAVPLSSLVSAHPLQSPLSNAISRAGMPISSATDVAPIECMLLVIASLAILFFAAAGSYVYALFEDTHQDRVLWLLAVTPTIPSYLVWTNVYHHIVSYFPRPITAQPNSNEHTSSAQLPRLRVLVKIKANRPAVGSAGRNIRDISSFRV